MSKSVLSISEILKAEANIVCIGNHQPIIQSILDFDYLSGKTSPSVSAIISKGKRSQRMFFGSKEVLLPVFDNIQDIPQKRRQQINFMLNMNSGRRVLSSTKDALSKLKLLGGAIFAESVPERHSVELISLSEQYGIWLLGPASVGLVVPGTIKLGAIGGIGSSQIADASLFGRGHAAVLSSSGGMTNEMINVVARAGLGISFSLSFGGDRFPILDPRQAILAAEKDPATKVIVYFGELGGDDEYRIIDLVKERKVSKPMVAYIAGSVADLFPAPPQFGHAKAMARTADESAIAKRKALNKAGIYAPDTFAEFVTRIEEFATKHPANIKQTAEDLSSRKGSLFVSTISRINEHGDVILVDKTLEQIADYSIGHVYGMLLLGKPKISDELAEIIELIIKILADHGPHVSGALNTMTAARAGKDLVSSLASGLLTIGPRFGGALNGAAGEILRGVNDNIPPQEFVEQTARAGKRIPGIGHRKYRVDMPDPRIKKLLKTSKTKGKYLNYAQEIEKITIQKNAKLILNIDGAIAAILLDILSTKEKLNRRQLQHLVEIEFFNAFFVLARAVGFTAHYFDQRRSDEGLLRLSKDDISEAEPFYFEE